MIVSIALGAAVLAISLAIAGAFVVREFHRMRSAPPPSLFSMDAAYEWVVLRVPDEIAETITPADVRRILALAAEYLGRSDAVVRDRASRRESRPPAPVPAVFGGPEMERFIRERAAAAGHAYAPEQVVAVVGCLASYLQAIGAVGSPAAGPGSNAPPPDGAT